MRSGFGLLQSPSGLLLVSNHNTALCPGWDGKTVCSGSCRLGCDFFERIGEKRIDVRRFLGYVCRIAKVRVRINFGWVSIFTKKNVKCDFFVHMRI
jgi:hypothetical protein